MEGWQTSAMIFLTYSISRSLEGLEYILPGLSTDGNRYLGVPVVNPGFNATQLEVFAPQRAHGGLTAAENSSSWVALSLTTLVTRGVWASDRLGHGRPHGYRLAKVFPEGRELSSGLRRRSGAGNGLWSGRASVGVEGA